MSEGVTSELGELRAQSASAQQVLISDMYLIPDPPPIHTILSEAVFTSLIQPGILALKYYFAL